MAPELTLHALAPSPPCMTADAALRLKGLEFERVDFPPGEHVEQMAALYGEGHTTVPGLMVDGEPVHGSRAITAKLETLQPDPPLFPPENAEAVREAERWGDEEFQDLGRRLPWGALHFRPEAMGTLRPDGEPLNPAGTDFAIGFTRATWKYHGLTAERLAADLEGLPAKLDHIDSLVEDGTLGGEQVNAADLQIGATLRVLRLVHDLHPLLADRPLNVIARETFPDLPGAIPAGAYPAGWTPQR